jgi:enoyl-CoA hydratase
MSDVKIDKQGKTTVFTIDRPGKMNAISAGVALDLQAGFAEFDASDATVAIITGAGTKAFSAGADLNDMPEIWRCFPTMGITTQKPIIVAVEGWCIGGALMMTALSDLCVASRSAKFSYPEGRIGLTMGVGPALAKRLPHKIAMEMLLLGNTFTADRAHDVGLVNRVTEDGEALNGALELAERLTTMAPMVLKTIKSTVNDHILTPTPSEVMFRRQAEIDIMLKSRDYAEGIAAFNEGRAPHFIDG